MPSLGLHIEKKTVRAVQKDVQIEVTGMNIT